MTGRDVTWVRRSRIEGDGWEGLDIPLGEENERYLVRLSQLGRIVSEVQVGAAFFPIPSAVWSQLQPSKVTVEVAQLSQTFGRGPFVRRDFDVQ